MGPTRLADHLTCINCGSAVHWTFFDCPVCGRNPREKEKETDIRIYSASPKSPGKERRKFPRYGFEGDIVLDGAFKGKMIDLSQGGAKFRTDQRRFCNELLHIDFIINGIPIHAVARVVHMKRGVLEENFTLGVSFETISRGLGKILSHQFQKHSTDGTRSQLYA